MRVWQPKFKDRNGEMKQGRNYWVQFGIGGKLVRKSLRTRDKRVAMMRAGQMVEKAERVAAGLVDPFEEHRTRPLQEHVDAFLADLENRGVSDGHAKDRALSLNQYLDATRAKTLAKVDVVEAQRWLADMAACGLSARSVNKRYQALRQFGKWLLRTRRASFDPFQGLSSRNEAVDRRRVRRALSPLECKRLLRSARTRPLVQARARRTLTGITDKERLRLTIMGETRAFIYAFAIGTGLRRGELRGLCWHDLDEHYSEVTVRASVAKSKRMQSLPLRADLRTALRQHRRRIEEAGYSVSATARVFPGALFPTHRTFRADLEYAGLDGEDDQGRVVDFHSFRNTFITGLSVAGVHPRVAQALARHSKIELTMQVYTDVNLLDLRAAVESTTPTSRPVAEEGHGDILSA